MDKKRRILIIYNSKSGHRRIRFEPYLRALAARDAQVETRTLSRDFNLKELLADAASFDRVVAAGGDGTVSAVAGLLQNTGIPIIPYPGGTANLLVRNLNITMNPEQLAEATVNGKTIAVDMGEMTYARYRRRDFFRRRILKRTLVPDVRTVYFVIIAGCGFFARLMQQVQALKKQYGESAYWMGAFMNLFPRRARFQIQYDGKQVTEKGIGVMIVNLDKIQLDLKVVPNSFRDDGKMEVAIMKPRNLFGLIPLIWGALIERLGFARPAMNEVLETYSASEIEVHSRPPLRLQIDGEPLHKASNFKIRVIPRAATFVCGNLPA